MRDAALARWLGVAAAGFLVVFLAYPLAVIIARSVSTESFLSVLSDPYYWRRTAFTFGQAVLSTLLTILAALPAAVAMGRFDFPGKRLLRSLLLIPFVMPTVVVAVGFLALVGPNGLLGVDLRGSFALLLLAHVFYNYPVVVRLVGSFLESSAPRLREAASTLGASPWRTLLRVDLPLAAPAIAAAAALVFVFTFTSFGVILILTPRLATLEVEIYRLTSRLLRLDAASVLVVVQLLVIAAVSRIYVVMQRRLAVAMGGIARPLPTPRGRQAYVLAGVLFLSTALALSPLISLLLNSLWLPGRDGFTLIGYLALLEAGPTVTFAGAGPAVVNSLLFAISATILALAVGFAFAYAVVRGGWSFLDDMSLLPLATSAVTLGFGYLLAFPQLAASREGLVLAHTLIAFPFVARALLPALRSLPVSLAEAAATLGASPLRRLWRLELPLLAPALGAGAALAFCVSLGEFGATLVLTRPEYATIPVAIFDRLGRPGVSNYASALALSVVLMVVTSASLLLLERSHRGEI